MQQELKSELTKQLIVDQAFHLFYENGFKTTSIDTIMNATSLTKGAFYHHYKSKKELALAVISSKIQNRVHEAMVLPLYEIGDALTLLEHTFLTRMKSFSRYEKKHGCAMNNLINEIGDYEAAYQEALKNIIETWKKALVLLINRGKAEGSIQCDISSTAVAVYLISAFEGIRGIGKLYTDDAIIDDYLLGLSYYIKQLSA
ncbi:TetR/AcrR family transcriptional regulator [Flavobacterium sp. SM2513]|uniref:TetR/AcrR family transcriptional regulator n=1 Tax=Flavobacterium sp. SM2513 TaxID=3424766 RepID=UPI003D7FC0DD